MFKKIMVTLLVLMLVPVIALSAQEPRPQGRPQMSPEMRQAFRRYRMTSESLFVRDSMIDRCLTEQLSRQNVNSDSVSTLVSALADNVFRHMEARHALMVEMRNHVPADQRRRMVDMIRRMEMGRDSTRRPPPK